MVKLQDKVNKDYFIDLYINQRKTMKEVAEILNIKYSAVNTLKNLWGITRKDDPIRKILSKDLLYDLYVNKNMGKWEISTYLNISYLTVDKNLKRYNIISHDPDNIVESIVNDYLSGLSTTQIARKYSRPKSRIRQILINNNIQLRDKYSCHCNNMQGEILNTDIFRSAKSSYFRRKVGSHFKNKLAIPLKKEYTKCSICGSFEHLHVHHLIPLSIIINKIVAENKNLTDDELYDKIITDSRYLDKSNLIVVCEKCHYTIFHPYINYHANKQPSLNNIKEGSETIS